MRGSNLLRWGMQNYQGSLRSRCMEQTTGMTFGGALNALKSGKEVCRNGWNAHHTLILQVPDENSKMSLPYIYMTIGGDARDLAGKLVPWVASHTDLLNEEWFVVDRD